MIPSATPSSAAPSSEPASSEPAPPALSVPLEGRIVALDTETTGLDPKSDRIIEIGAVEMIDGRITGRTYHAYINPDRSVPRDAFQVHGLSRQFLLSFPRFGEIAEAFMEFIADSRLVIHNAPFDMGFLDEEMKRIGLPAIDRGRVHDTIPMVRSKFPGSQVSLNRVARRYGVSTEGRSLHGGLVDAHILAQIFACLSGADPRDLFGVSAAPGIGRTETRPADAGSGPSPSPGETTPGVTPPGAAAAARRPRVFRFDPAETAAHEAHVQSEVRDPLWTKISGGGKPSGPGSPSL